MRVCLFDHHQKARYLGYTLHQAGFEFSEDPDKFDYELMLVDSDHPQAVPYPQKHQWVQIAAKRGIPIVLYPHGANPDLDMDGLRKGTVPVSCQLVHGEGHKEINRRFGSTRRVEVIGWSYCETVTPDLPSAVSQLLFAPIHPWANGRDILDMHRYLNQRAYREFLEHPAPRKLVRMYGEDAPNGVYERVDGISYEQSDLTLGIPLIDSADAVISFGTFAYTALARGKPVAFINPYPPETSDDGLTRAAHFDDYAEYSRYPAGVGDAPLDELFTRDVAEWKRLFVGEPLDADHLVSVLRSLRPNRATRRALARA